MRLPTAVTATLLLTMLVGCGAEPAAAPEAPTAATEAATSQRAEGRAPAMGLSRTLGSFLTGTSDPIVWHSGTLTTYRPDGPIWFSRIEPDEGGSRVLVHSFHDAYRPRVEGDRVTYVLLGDPPFARAHLVHRP